MHLHRISIDLAITLPHPAFPILLLLLSPCVVMADNAEDMAFFESQVRPVFVERCQECHGDKKQSSGLRVDSRAALIGGGDGGAAVIPGDAQNSLLVRAIRHLGDLQMPPKAKLSPREIRSIEKWIELGAVWPAEDVPAAADSDTGKDHWAFQRVSDPVPPNLPNDRWIRSPIDAFVKRRLIEKRLAPSPQADRRSLIRRLYYTLTGLPPTVDDVERFRTTTGQDDYGELVDRLLESPAYGEHWARHWLDIARYSDTKGYVYGREERHWVHSWTYRDWVATALNGNMPYDRFLLLQLAADQVDDCTTGDLAAMGFLTLGRRFLGVNRDIIDDRIDVVCRGMLGLTVSCARCHDHKYDPIPTADYYSLYGVFDSCSERLVSLQSSDDRDFQSELQKRQTALTEKLATAREEASQRSRDRVADYLHAQSELHKYPANGFDQIFQKDDLLPAFVRRWESYLYEAGRRSDPIFLAWHAYRQIPEKNFEAQSELVTFQLHKPAAQPINEIIAQKFTTPPQSFHEVIRRYGEVFEEIATAWQKLLAEAGENVDRSPPERLPDPAAEQLRQILYADGSPCIVPDEPIVRTETFFDSATCTELWKLQGEVDRWIINSPASEPFALTLVDRSVPTEPRVFRRGNPLKQGQSVPRRFLSVLSDKPNEPFQYGSGRLELARSIIHPDNPLTARVIVNRIWTQHFGRGLVTTPSDFGTRAAAPSHPDLLDWLASRFVADGWDLKKLHRRILLSATFQQSSAPAVKSEWDRAMQIDPENRFLWRMSPRRLSFEELSDSLLAASGQLDLQMQGKPVGMLEKPYLRRRTIYAKVDRQYLPGTLRVFDFANPDLHTPRRAETTVPQQALFLMNHPLMLERAASLADLAKQGSTAEQSVDILFRSTLQRLPTQEELVEALQLVRSAATIESDVPSETAADWQYGYGMLDETQQRVQGFMPLPHFTGDAWQGGTKWPDQKLGWVQLTAKGGHPGNDRRHAAIRRWTAPRAMTIQIRSKLIHQRPPGDGVRAFIAASHRGLLSSAKVHQSTAELNVDPLEVSAGDTIDFLVDIDKVLNSDEHLWIQSIEERLSDGTISTKWNSESDFPSRRPHPMDGWEQLAQVLFCTNEFTFVD